MITVFFPLMFPSRLPLFRVFWRMMWFFFGFHLGLRIVVDKGQSFPDGALGFLCDKVPAPTWMRVKILFAYSWPHCHHHGVALKIQLLHREGSARFAVGHQHRDRKGPTHLMHPTGHLDSSNQSSLQGHSPASTAASGLRSLWRFPKSRLARDLGV